MLKKFVLFLFLWAILLGLAACKGGDESDTVVFYYSLTCPHCKNVEKYIADNNVKDKVRFEEKEVSQNKDNAEEFGQRIVQCKINPAEAGVPLLWDGEKEICLLGDEKIIGYFFQKMGEFENNE